MKKTLCLFISALLFLLFCRCGDSLDYLEKENKLFSIETKSSIIDLDNAVYDQSISSWLIEKGDPYKLSNFNEALFAVDNSCSEALSPTHYVLTVYAKSLKELDSLSNNSALCVSYYPPSYCLASDFESKLLDRSIGRDSRLLHEDIKYQEIYTIVDQDGTEREISQNLPVLYIIWPISVPIPEHLDYLVDYAVFIPSSTERTDILVAAEKEAIKRTGWFNKQLDGIKASRGLTGAKGYIYHYDTLLDSNLAMINLKVRFQVGSNIVTAYTNQNGRFQVTVVEGSSASCVYERSQWKITESNSTTPIQQYLGNVEDFGTNGLFILTSRESIIHMAVNYYFNGTHSIGLPSCNDVLRIIMTRTIHLGDGCFTTPIIGTPYIDIYDNYYSNTGELFATVCHELGHRTHYYFKNNRIGYMTTHSLIKESYASYVSWIISNEFYHSVWGNGEPPTDWNSSFHQDKQSWKKTGDSNYSPLFVDMVDTKNQWTENHEYNYDTVSLVPNTVIQDIAVNSNTWTQVKNNLSGYIGSVITSNEYNQIVSPYDYFFSNN